MKKYMTALGMIVATALAAAAPEPVAVWNGDFSQVVDGYALDLNGSFLSADNTTITITNEYAGVDIDFSNPMTSGLTVLFKYADLQKGDRAKMIFTTCVAANYDKDRTGVDLQTNDALWGAWHTLLGDAASSRVPHTKCLEIKKMKFGDIPIVKADKKMV